MFMWVCSRVFLKDSLHLRCCTFNCSINTPNKLSILKIPHWLMVFFSFRVYNRLDGCKSVVMICAEVKFNAVKSTNSLVMSG